MKAAAVLCCLLALVALGSGHTGKTTFEAHKVLRFDLSDDSAGVKRELLGSLVRELDLDLWAEHPEWVDVRVQAELHHRIDSLGLAYTILIQDLQALIDEIEVLNTQKANDPFFSAFRTHEEFEFFMDNLVKQFPNLVTKINIGKSIQGRNINGIVISSSVNPPSSKKGIVFNGGQHAREWVSPMTNAWIAHQLVNLYGKDAQVTELVDRFEWTIVPVLNPDGYVYTWTNNRMWRKNLRVNEDSWFGCLGVDNNRNWDFHWNEGGSSPDTCSDAYHGPKPFSEPEEVSIASYIKTKGNVISYIDFHSYSQLWMTPWGYTSTLPDDYPELLATAKKCVEALTAVYGTQYQYGAISTTIYPASGSSVDWTYGAANVKYSFAVELRDTGRYGFVLPPGEIVPTGEETFAAVRALGAHLLTKL